MKKQSWRDGTWVVVLCCFLMNFTSLGFCSSPKGFYLDEVTKVLGISRSAFALNDTVRYLVIAIASLYFAVILKKLGTKKMIVLGFSLLIASQLTCAMATNVVTFWVGGALLGGGLSLVSNTTVSYIINRRVRKNTGTVLGLALSANGLGGAVSIPMISWCIDNAPGGYRTAYYLVALILAVVAVVICLLFREDTSTPHEAPAKKKSRSTWEGIPFDYGRKLPILYIACILSFLSAFTLSGINGISKAHCRDVGFTNAALAGIWSCHSLALMGGKFLTGIVYDKKGLRWMLLTAQSAAVIVLLALSMAETTPFGTAMVWVYSIFSALSIPLETIGVSLITGDLFGNRDYAKFLGVMTAANSLGFGLGNPGFNLVYDLCGTYRPGILAGAAITAAIAIAFQFAITAAYKERTKQLGSPSGRAGAAGD